MRDGRAYLAFISDFWTSIWTDAKVLSAVIGAQHEILYRLYLQAVRAAVPDFIDQLPLYREDFWHLILVAESSRVTAGQPTFLLQSDYHRIPFLYDRMFDPLVSMREATDYTLATDNGETTVTFAIDPFAPGVPRFPVRDLGDDRQIVMFAPKVYVDRDDLFEAFGHFTRIVQPTSEQYRQLVKGVLFIYAHGPVLQPLNAGLNLAAGYPVSRDHDKVTSISVDAGSYVIGTAKGHVYRVPDVATLSVAIGTILRPMSTFILDIRVFDHISDPEWWSGGPGNVDPAKRVVNFLPVDLVPELSEPLRDDAAVIDYMMDTYLKFNLLGLSVNTLALTTFNAIEDFFRVLYEVKPHYTSPYTNAFFKVSESWALPQEAIEIVAAIDLTTGLALDDVGPGGAEYWTFPADLKLNARLRLGPRHRDMLSLEHTAHDNPQLEAGFDLSPRNAIMGGPVTLNSLRVLGNYPDGGVRERITIGVEFDTDDTVTLGDDRVQLVMQVENRLGDESFYLGDSDYFLGENYGLGVDPVVFGDALLP